jgi:hypothetical protein
MFDVTQAKAQVDAVPKLALPYFLDACDEIEKLRAERGREKELAEALRPFIPVQWSGVSGQDPRPRGAAALRRYDEAQS